MKARSQTGSLKSSPKVWALMQITAGMVSVCIALAAFLALVIALPSIAALFPEQAANC